MEHEEWNRYQLEMFDKLKSMDEEVRFSDVVDSYKDDVLVWKMFDSILDSSVDEYDFYTNVSKILFYNGYLIIKFRLWEYLVINIVNNKVLTKEEILMEIGESVFKKLDNEDNEFEYFYFYECDDPFNIVSYFINNQDVLLGKRKVNYQYQDDTGRIGIDFNLVRNDIIIYIHSFGNDRRVNYINVSGDFKPLSVSNPTGNMEELRELAKELKDIKVSSSLLKERVKIKKLV